jgi:hypothetical protein
MSSKFKLLFSIVFGLAWVASPLLAQTPGTLRGVVTDPSAAVIPGATVVANGNGVTRTAKSDNQGRYTLTNVPAGSYTVRADASGFVTFVKSGMDVAAGQNTSLDIALQIAAEAQQVQVTDQSAAQLSVDASANVGAIVLKEEDLEQLPDDPDDLQADLEALAGPASGPNGAQFFVDGFSGGQLPPKSSIREIRINSNPFSSEFDRPGFGRVEILTRPGTDNYHGSAFIQYGNKDFDTRNPLLTATQPPTYNSTLFTANIGGPINKKSSFFLDFNKRNINENALVTAEVLPSVLNPSCLSAAAGCFNPQSYNAAIVTPNHLWMISPRLDYAINQNNTLIIRYNHTDSSNEGGVGQFALPTQETQSFTKGNTVQITETSVIAGKIIDETRFQFRDNHVSQNGLGDFSVPAVDVASSFNSGGAPFSSNYNNTTGYELQNLLTTTKGAHALKFGFRARQTDLYTQSYSNFNGSYSFNTPNTSSGNIPACLAGYSNPTSLDLYARTETLLAQGVPMSTIIAEGCGPSSFTLGGGVPRVYVRQFDLGLFAQDDWRVRPNLTINVGLRYETQNNVKDHFDLAPRFGFAWAPGVKGNKASKTVIRGGWGIFFDRINENNVLQALRLNGVTQQNYLITTNTNNPQALAAAQAALAYFCPQGTGANCQAGVPPTSLLTVQNQAIWTLDKGMRAPYMMQAAIGVDRQLPGRTQLSVNFVNTRGVHTLYQRDINAYLPGTYTGPNTGIRPYPGGDIYQYETAGAYKQFQIMTNVSTRVNSHVQLQGYYVYGQAHSNALGFPMDQYNDNLDWGRANFDVRNRGFVGGTVGLPLKMQLAPFVTMQSGNPFDITTGNDYNGDGIYNARPAFASASLCGTSPNIKCTKYGDFNLNPAPGQALIPSNYGEGPAQYSVNLRLSRTWGWGERAAGNQNQNRGGGGGFGGPPGGGRGGPPGGGRGGFGGGGRGGFGGLGGGGTGKRYNLTATVSARNAFNHTNLGTPQGSLTSPFFGQSTTLAGQGGGPFGGGNGAAGNRKVELQLRFQF